MNKCGRDDEEGGPMKISKERESERFMVDYGTDGLITF